jgi:hypothetical protein
MLFSGGCSDGDACEQLLSEYKALTCLDSGHKPMFTKEIHDKMNALKEEGCSIPSDC